MQQTNMEVVYESTSTNKLKLIIKHNYQYVVINHISNS